MSEEDFHSFHSKASIIDEICSSNAARHGAGSAAVWGPL